MRSEIFVVLKIHVVIWAMMLCRLVDDYPHEYFRGMYYLYIHFCPEHGVSLFLHNTGIHAPEYTVLYFSGSHYDVRLIINM
jgi:hypothetical protein